MNVTMRLTIDGLTRALRAVVHDLTERAEQEFAAEQRLAGNLKRDRLPEVQPERPVR